MSNGKLTKAIKEDIIWKVIHEKYSHLEKIKMLAWGEMIKKLKAYEDGRNKYILFLNKLKYEMSEEDIMSYISSSNYISMQYENLNGSHITIKFNVDRYVLSKYDSSINYTFYSKFKEDELAVEISGAMSKFYNEKIVFERQLINSLAQFTTIKKLVDTIPTIIKYLPNNEVHAKQKNELIDPKSIKFLNDISS